MTPATTPRIADAKDLGRAGRRIDIALGLAAMAPILGLGWAAATTGGETLATVRTAAALWTGGLLAFLAGVRRGLSFSEYAGARLTEICSFLGVFGVGLLTLALRSPGLGALGLATVGGLDWAAARRGQAPDYFRLFRPAQMAAGCLGLVVIAAFAGA